MVLDMIVIEIRKNKQNGCYTGFSCKGHAGFANAGKDVVCAAISVLVINTLNALEELSGEKDNMIVESEELSGIIDCRFKEALTAPGSQLLMDALVLGCKGVTQSYGTQYVKLKYKEV